ncbi:hypothetical protein Syun_020070 [Stephania yunnanensis]|uniref:Myb-like domain-containing protein n=1 Tax=Stephania yunnanensis TaxID=152371 RepID=A0AAP0NX87_9MAGN
MDGAFRDATLKGPLWEDVSRKLGEQGYIRSAKKCKEKFENVHKYYKRTKEGRAGRQDGKTYRFFSQLEALHTSAASASASAPASAPSSAPPVNLAATPVSIGISMVAPGSSSRMQTPPPDLPTTASAPASQNIPVPRLGPPDPAPSGSAAAAGAISFSSNTSSSSSDSEEDDDDHDHHLHHLEGAPPNTHSRKRKRGSGGGGGGESSSSSSSRKMMEFFEGLMKQVMEKQEAMQQRFLEAIEKREQERMIREEAWKRQEMARLAREHDLMAQERAISASRDAAIIAFLQKITGQTIQLPPAVVIPAAPPPQPAPAAAAAAATVTPQQTSSSTPPPPPHHPPPATHHHHRHHHHQNPSTEIVVASEQQHQPLLDMMVGGSGGGGGSFDPTSSRWPKAEVLALINLRSGLETRYQEAGPKGPLWEEISAGMRRLGYNRSSKRCKEKWENINKYFKKVKESNKKRPEDAKTCPYFHQLDALYRKKMGMGMGMGASAPGGGSTSSTSSGFVNRQEQQMIEQTIPAPLDAPPTSAAAATLQSLAAAAAAPLPTQQPTETEGNKKNSESSKSKNTGTMEGVLQSGAKEGLFEDIQGSSGGGGARGTKKPEDIMKELLGHRQLAMEAAGDSDNIDLEDEEEDEDDDDDDVDDDMEEEEEDGEETEEEERKMGL